MTDFRGEDEAPASSDAALGTSPNERAWRQTGARWLHLNRLAALGEMAASVMHEVNNPATSVTFNLDLLATGISRAHLSPAVARELLGLVDDCRAGIAAMTEAAQSVRDYSREEVPAPSRCDLDTVVRQALQLAAAHLRRTAHVRLELHRDLWVNGRPPELKQLVVNLLINASQAVQGDAPGRRGSIVIRTHRYEDAVHLEVQDDGPGIPPEIREHIFEPFYTTKSEGTGTGLGLAICARIAQSHGGSIEVESESGRGALLRVVLPRIA